MTETTNSAIPPYAVRVVAEEGSWTVWPGSLGGVRLQIHGVTGEVLEVELTPADGADRLALQASRLTPEGTGWEALYDGPVRPLEAAPATVAWPKCRHRWAPQVEMPVKCPKCSCRVGAYWRRQRQAAAGVPREGQA